jgi:hypothetical protein
MFSVAELTETRAEPKAAVGTPADIEQHVSYRIANALVRSYPFPHLYVENVFPPDFYAELLARLPDLSVYQNIEQGGTVKKTGAYAARHVCRLPEATRGDPFWDELSGWVLGDAFMHLTLEKFRPEVEARFEAGQQVSVARDARLVRDFTTYAISPHTDHPKKLLSFLFYLPRDTRQSHLGTSVYLPRQRGFEFHGGQHLPFEHFRRVATMPYVPNSLFAFARSDVSFHGVEPITDAEVERNLLLYNVYAGSAVE